jgi:hypothetical protein
MFKYAASAGGRRYEFEHVQVNFPDVGQPAAAG